MTLPRLPCVCALTLAVAAPAAAQSTSDALFRSYLVEHGATSLVGPLEVGGESEHADDRSSSAASWFVGTRQYVVGGVAALAAGLALSQHVASAGAATAAPGALPTVATNEPVASPTVVVNPEPGTLLLLGTGLAAVAVGTRRRRAR